eukprot:NODE_143_length_17796_cov_0.252020.p9 type:complete len:224 gc:universal NODE_143_length_17796_cov_0.252020:12612-11941(-)
MPKVLANLLRKNMEFAKIYGFKDLGYNQSPHTLWIGCVDSRVSPELITGSNIGDILVHRNMGNLVKEIDHTNGLIHFAVKLLGIRNIVVCGHTNCGACYRSIRGGLHGMDIWLRDSRNRYLKELQPGLLNASNADGNIKNEFMNDADIRTDSLNERTMEEQAQVLSKINTINGIDIIAQHEDVIEVWERSEDLTLSGLFLNVENGSLELLKTMTKIKSSDEKI